MDGLGGGSGTGRRYQPQDSAPTSGSSGGLGDLWGQLTGQSAPQPTQRRRTNAPSGGLEDMLGGGQSGGGLGDLLGQLTGGNQGGASGGSLGGGLGDLLGAVLGGAAGGGLSPNAPAHHQDLTAALILRAMVSAAKADGKLDEAEKQKLMQHAEGASQQEIAYIKAELERRTDVDALAG